MTQQTHKHHERTPRPRQRQSGMTVLEISISMMVLSMASLFSLSVTVSSAQLDKVNREEANATAVVRRLVEEMQSVPFEQLYASFNGDASDDPDGAGTAPGNDFTVLADDSGNLVMADDTSAGSREGTGDSSGSWGSGSWGHKTGDTTTSGGWWDWWNDMGSSWHDWHSKKTSSWGDETDQALKKKGASRVEQKFKRVPVEVDLTFPENGGGQLQETVRHPLLGNRQWDLNGDGQVNGGSRKEDYKMLPVVIELTWEGAGGTRTFQVAHVFTDH